MKKIAVFPGSFDPITLGHADLIEIGSSLFDELIVAVGVNSAKSGLFPIENRLNWIETACKHLKNVKVRQFSGLTIDFCVEQNARYILRGLRSGTDLDYESGIAIMNHKMNHQIETVFLMSKVENAAISSSIVREIFKAGGKVDQFLPKGIAL